MLENILSRNWSRNYLRLRLTNMLSASFLILELIPSLRRSGGQRSSGQSSRYKCRCFELHLQTCWGRSQEHVRRRSDSPEHFSGENLKTFPTKWSLNKWTLTSRAKFSVWAAWKKLLKMPSLSSKPVSKIWLRSRKFLKVSLLVAVFFQFLWYAFF